jgi:hypothetical protein
MIGMDFVAAVPGIKTCIVWICNQNGCWMVNKSNSGNENKWEDPKKDGSKECMNRVEKMK